MEKRMEWKQFSNTNLLICVFPFMHSVKNHSELLEFRDDDSGYSIVLEFSRILNKITRIA